MATGRTHGAFSSTGDPILIGEGFREPLLAAEGANQKAVSVECESWMRRIIWLAVALFQVHCRVSKLGAKTQAPGRTLPSRNRMKFAESQDIPRGRLPFCSDASKNTLNKAG